MKSLKMSTFYFISLIVLNIALISAKLTFIEVKYPLLVNISITLYDIWTIDEYS